MKFTEIAARLNSIGTPFLSVGWTPSKSDAEIARRTIRFLEDRRVLFNPSAVEEPRHCAESVLQIRERVTAALEEAAEGSELFQASCGNPGGLPEISRFRTYPVDRRD